MSDLQHQRPATTQPLRSLRDHHSQCREPIRAGEQRQSRLVVGNSLREFRVIGGDVRRIRHDHVHQSLHITG